jgi:PEP-CTERM motif
MNLRLRTLLIVSLIALFTVSANAGASFVIGTPPMAPMTPTTTVTFDDLTNLFNPVPNGYGGLNWSNFYVLDGVNYFDNPSGYQNGVVSPNNIAYNAYGAPASILEFGKPFYVDDFYTTAAWRDNLYISIVGYLGGNPVISGSGYIDTTSPTYWFATGDVWIDTLTFTTSGGVNHGYNGDGTHFALDNFTYSTTPEPATLLLIGTGIVGLARKLRK